MSQNTKLKQVALWYVRNQGRAMYMHAKLPDSWNINNFVNIEILNKLKEILGAKLIEDAETWIVKHPQSNCENPTRKQP